jgi:methyl-accepting chemotaxis protein|tara:strand:+ start:3077 stop:3571 length:495 start_codon:yes stop_codon:yes gene_type:complete
MTDEQQMVSEDDYSTYTVYELKDDLKERGLKVSGKKADLISRLVSDLNSTIESVENVIEQTEEAAEAIEIAADEVQDVADKISERDVKGALTELKDASDDIEKAAEETMEAVEDALETAEELEGKANTIVTRWNALSRNQKLMGGLVAIVVIGFVAISGGYITF